MNMEFYRKLPIPKEIKEQYPVSEELKARRDACVNELKDVFSGKSDKFVLVIGPCSADSEQPVLDYIGRLRVLQDKIKDKIIIVPRIYTGKPRTTGDGYKGMVHQPNPEGKPDLLKGIIAIRELHMRALKDTGFSCADEMLYPEMVAKLERRVYIVLLTVRHKHADNAILAECFNAKRRRNGAILAAGNSDHGVTTLAVFIEKVAYPIYAIFLYLLCVKHF